jgi:hypothetical protein
MARRTKTVTIAAENRDKGKTFLLTEMPPRQAEKWATRALLALSKSGRVELPDDFRELLATGGLPALAAIGMGAIAAIHFDEAEPLMDEMFSCAAFVPDPSKIDQMTQQPIVRPIREDDIEEVSTILYLRNEVIELHLGFSIAAGLSRFGSAAKKALNINDTSTSPKPSE